jgi:hypothetical protein
MSQNITVMKVEDPAGKIADEVIRLVKDNYG